MANTDHTSPHLCTGGLSNQCGATIAMMRGRAGQILPEGWETFAAGCIDAPEYLPAGSSFPPAELGDSHVPTWTTRE